MNKIRVDNVVNRLQLKKKSSYLTRFFKSVLIRKIENIDYGQIHVSDGEEEFKFGNSDSMPIVKIQIKSPEFYVMLGTDGLLGAAEAYANGLWLADDLVMLIRIIIRNNNVMGKLESGLSKLMKPINYFIHWKRKNSIAGSKKNILAHYDLSNEFYQLWLDETMTYSCGIFQSQDTSMKDASIEKLDRICRKLNLTDKDSVLEIGTGWGSFAMHAAKNYNCHVTTTTISDAQYDYVKEKIETSDLSEKITLLKTDYRELTGKYDKIVSIEMIEAVGHEYVPLYFKKVSSLLNDEGLFGIQGITYNDQKFDVYKNSVDLIKKYIFPGSCLISISQVTDIMKKYTDLSLSHLEDITMHYATTLEKWRNNFYSEIEDIKKLGFSNEFIKMWEFYFVYCEAGFKERHIGDYQFVFSKPAVKNINIQY